MHKQWNEKNGNFYFLIVISKSTILFYPATVIWVVPFPQRKRNQMSCLLPWLMFLSPPGRLASSFLWLLPPLGSVLTSSPNASPIFIIKPSQNIPIHPNLILLWPLSESHDWTIHHSSSNLVSLFIIFCVILNFPNRQ